MVMVLTGSCTGSRVGPGVTLKRVGKMDVWADALRALRALRASSWVQQPRTTRSVSAFFFLKRGAVCVANGMVTSNIMLTVGYLGEEHVGSQYFLSTFLQFEIFHSK